MVGTLSFAHPRLSNAATKKAAQPDRLFQFIIAFRSAAIAADHRAHRVVGAEILSAVDIEQG